jgi:hypothetical protein
MSTGEQLIGLVGIDNLILFRHQIEISIEKNQSDETQLILSQKHKV